MSPFWQEVIGKSDPNTLAAAFVFALIGHFIILLAGTTLRNPTSTTSPIKFSWSYLFCDNAKRIIYVILLIIVALRFMPDLFGMTLTPFAGFLVGSALDSIALMIKQKTHLLDPK